MRTLRTGADSKGIFIPDGYASKQGSDGHVVVIRLVATSHPKGPMDE